MTDSSWAIAARIEYYNDEHGVIISSGTINGFQSGGYSLNFDHNPVKNVLVRPEARSFKRKDEIFVKQKPLITIRSLRDQLPLTCKLVWMKA